MASWFPIGEVFGGLEGPVKTIREAPPQVRHGASTRRVGGSARVIVSAHAPRLAVFEDHRSGSWWTSRALGQRVRMAAELRELNRIGVNLNQMARALNSGAVSSPGLVLGHAIHPGGFRNYGPVQ